MIKSPIVTGSEFNGYPLLPYEGPNAGYYSGILKIIQDRMEDALARTSQVLIVRLVVKLPSIVNGHDNSCFQYFIEEYRRAIGLNFYTTFGCVRSMARITHTGIYCLTMTRTK